MGQTHEQRLAKLSDDELVHELHIWVEGGLFWRTMARVHPEHSKLQWQAAYADLALVTAEYMQRHGDAPPAGWPRRFDADHEFVP